MGFLYERPGLWRASPMVGGQPWSHRSAYSFSWDQTAPAEIPAEIQSPHAREVTALYRRYNPSKLPDVPALLHKHRGREELLIQRIKQKYLTKERLVAFWEAHMRHAKTPVAAQFYQDKLRGVNGTLTKWVDREDQVPG